MTVLIEDDRGHDYASGNQAFGIFLGTDPGQAGPKRGTNQPPQEAAATEPTPPEIAVRWVAKVPKLPTSNELASLGTFAVDLRATYVAIEAPIVVLWNRSRTRMQNTKLNGKSPFSCGIHMKNRAYKGPRGEVVLAAWVNLEAGL